jgi:hypothetical protein
MAPAQGRHTVHLLLQRGAEFSETRSDMEQNRSGTVVDRRGDDRVNYPLPGGGVMPTPRNFPTEGPIPDGSGTGDTGATQNTERPTR